MLDLAQGVLEEFAERATHDLSQFVDAGLGVWRKDNPTTHYERTRRWRLNNKAKVSAQNKRYREKRKASLTKHLHVPT